MSNYRVSLDWCDFCVEHEILYSCRPCSCLQYEFETENGYISWYQDYVQEREEQKLQRRKRDEMAKQEHEKSAHKKQEASVAAKNALPAIPPKRNSAAITNPVSVAEKAKVDPPVCNAILMPQRVSSPITAGSNIALATPNSVNIKEFENLGEDPFESAELKTINDMEELKSLLSQTVSSDQPSPVSIKDASESERASTNGEALTNKPAKIDKPHNDMYENVFKKRSKTPDIYENSTVSASAVRPNSVTNVKLPIPAPRSCNSEPNSPQQTKSLDQPPMTTAFEENSPSSIDKVETEDNSTAQKPALKPKPKPWKPKSTTTSAKVASISNQIESDLNKAAKQKRGQLVGFSYTVASKESESIKDIEWPMMESQSPSTTAITTSPFENTVTTSSASNTKPVATAFKFSSEIKSDKRSKPVRPPPPAPKKVQVKKSPASDNAGVSRAINGVSCVVGLLE